MVYICIQSEETMTVPKISAEYADENNANTKVIFKNSASFEKGITNINNAQVDNAQDINDVMSMYNLLEYSNHYSKTSGSLYQFAEMNHH